MKTITQLIALLITFSVAQAQRTIPGLASPESVVAYEDGYFVSNIGAKLDPVAKDGDGSIYFIKKGKVIPANFAGDTLNAPKGLEVIGQHLYVADIDHVRGYDIPSHKKIFDLNLEGKAVLLNDVTKVSDSLLAISDSFKGNVLLVNVRNGEWKVLNGEVPMSNGLAYDAHTDMLYVCSMGPNLDGSGKIFGKHLRNDGEAFTVLENSPSGLFDGLVQLDEHRLLLSDWITVKNPAEGKLVVYDLVSKTSRVIKTERSPADIALDLHNRTLLIPQLLDNRLVLVPLKSLGL
ncbi:SMP-30/gluconolactonase/LRE family protein [Chitinophaga vietnamensis]|uniref:hypothetical protein n=1 Tax=Chitinophaga vietnamensis TaxID=2593957 RepID=UPI001177BA5F|nr:hypothetical protein [Chitinophaga vietnamensis]